MSTTIRLKLVTAADASKNDASSASTQLDAKAEMKRAAATSCYKYVESYPRLVDSSFSFVTSRPLARWAACLPVLRLCTRWSKNGFSPHCFDKSEIWHGRADPRSAPPCQISLLVRQKCENTAPKLSKFGILPTNLSLRGDSYDSVCTHL